MRSDNLVGDGGQSLVEGNSGRDERLIVTEMFSRGGCRSGLRPFLEEVLEVGRGDGDRDWVDGRVEGSE